MDDRCKYRFCGVVLWQNGRGRKREYCDDGCRQAEHRARVQDEAKQAALQEVASWGNFQQATIEYLAGLITAGSPETARKMAGMFQAEQGQIPAPAGKSKPLGKLDRQELEQARETLPRLYQQSARQSEEIHQWVERCKDLKMHLEIAQEKTKNLEIELANAPQ